MGNSGWFREIDAPIRQGGLRALRLLARQGISLICRGDQRSSERRLSLDLSGPGAPLVRCVECRSVASKRMPWHLRELGAHDGISPSRCEQGHQKLNDGESADQELSQTRSIAEGLGSGPKTLLGRALNRLQRSVETNNHGERLYHGQCLEDFPDIIRPNRVLDEMRRKVPTVRITDSLGIQEHVRPKHECRSVIGRGSAQNNSLVSSAQCVMLT